MYATVEYTRCHTSVLEPGDKVNVDGEFLELESKLRAGDDGVRLFFKGQVKTLYVHDDDDVEVER
jgi:hypothetical protein